MLIGGAACNLLEEELDMNPRATKDLDLVLVVEVLTSDFGARLWDFIKSANYAGRSKGENEFNLEHSRNIDDIHVASPETLICLKAKAYTEMLDRKAVGEQVDSRDIENHKKDVFRLIAMLPQDSRFSLPEKLRHDMIDFYQRIGELPNPDFFKNAGLRGLDAQRILDLFNTAFL